MWEILAKLVVSVFTRKSAETLFETLGTAIGKRVVEQLQPLTPDELALPAGITVIPKGLRAFNEDDASFFLSLLPGPVREDGLPITEYLPEDHEGRQIHGLVKDPTPDKGCQMKDKATEREEERRRRPS